MKKFIILTLMFALLAGAAFAQGWSVSGQGELGTMLNFNADKVATNEVKQFNEDEELILPTNATNRILIGANSYHNIDYYGYIGAMLGIRYNNGGLSTGLDFYSKRDGRSIVGVINYSSPIAAFGIENNIVDVLNADGTGAITNNGRLWGYYKFLDGMIHLEAAAKSRDANFWAGSTVVSDIFNAQIIGVNPGEGGYFDLNFGAGFTDPDKHNYLLVNVAPIDGLEVGLMFPGVFVFGGSSGGGAGGLTQGVADGANAGTGNSNSGIPGYKGASLQSGNYHVDFLNDTLLRSRLGASYSSGPFRAAFHFTFIGTEQKMKVVDSGKWDLNKNGKLDNTETKDNYKDATGKSFPDTKLVVAETRKVKQGDGSEVEVADIYTAIPGLYLGASYAINDMISAQLGFQGEFYSQKPRLGVGLGVNLGMGNLNAGLAFGLHTEINPDQDIVYYNAKLDEKDKGSFGAGDFERKYEYWGYSTKKSVEDGKWAVVDSSTSWFGLKPSVSYTIVENYLAASLNANLWFAVDQSRLHDNSWQTGVIAYEVTPELFFNVAGTGAATNYYGGLGTAIIVRYKIAGYADGSDLAAYKKQFKPLSDVNDAAVFTRPDYNGLDITFKWAF